MDTRSLRWFSKKAFQVGDGRPVGRTRYRSTVDLATCVELGQLADDTRRAPGRVGAGEAASELAQLLGDERSFGSACLTQATPVIAKAGALPGDDGARLDEAQVLAPAGPDSCQVGPEHPAGPLEDRELMAQGEHFELERCSRAQGGEDPADEEKREGGHGGLARRACPPIIRVPGMTHRPPFQA
jgi:hypothetical protein